MKHSIAIITRNNTLDRGNSTLSKRKLKKMNEYFRCNVTTRGTTLLPDPPNKFFLKIQNQLNRLSSNLKGAVSWFELNIFTFSFSVFIVSNSLLGYFDRLLKCECHLLSYKWCTVLTILCYVNMACAKFFLHCLWTYRQNKVFVLSHFLNSSFKYWLFFLFSNH